MFFLKKKLLKENLIYKTSINNLNTKKVTNFYKQNPFPNYKLNDNKFTIIDKGDKNYLTSNFKNFIGFDKNVLEVGCGTGQFSMYFAIGTNNRVVGLDATLQSLELASDFAIKNDINNVSFVNSDIFDDLLQENFFDFIWLNGVLHHTKDPYEAFKIVVKYLKNQGYILVGLYNRFGRIRTIIRKYIYKIFGGERGWGVNILSFLDKTLRNLKENKKDKEAWIKDQYHHPVESLHTIDEVLLWFSKHNIDFVSSIPSCAFETDPYKDLFIKKSKGNFLSRIINQINMIFNNLDSDGGLFIVIGKKMNIKDN